MILTMEDAINGKEEAYSGRDRCEAASGRCADSDGSTGLLSVIDGAKRLSANVHCAEGRAAIAA